MDTATRHFKEFFYEACKYDPYGYQCRLACGEKANPDQSSTLKKGRACESLLIDIPTGLGKTAAVGMAWLWNRVTHPDPNHRKKWPRRLVYCLPMRTLVEQTHDEITRWRKNLGLTEQVGVHLLMGGEDDGDWDIHPERPTILIGTQDMLLSRALNRGYGMSRFRWPMHFALLNNDCLWIMDEVQLMGNGLATGIQLDGFRTKLWCPAKPCATWWMSATSSTNAFTTTDRTELCVPPPRPFNLTDQDQHSEELRPRLNANKTIELRTKVPHADDILQWHQKGRLTLLIVNTVKSATCWYDNIQKHLIAPQKKSKKGKSAIESNPEILLLHSRYRRADRDVQMKRLEAFLQLVDNSGIAPGNHPGLILIATQVIEAGIDLSSATLCSEVAPWASIIQRLGRLNRDDKHPDAVAKFWNPGKDEENGKNAPNAGRVGPYEKTDLTQAEKLIEAVIREKGRSKTYRQALDHIQSSELSADALNREPTAVIRADDVYGLFSTEPDLAGGFTDISPFIRTTDLSADVSVYWREFKDRPAEEMPAPGRNELLNIPSFILGQFLQESGQSAFLWNEETEEWDTIKRNAVVPGMTLLLPINAGGYSDEKGWTGNSRDKPTVLPLPSTSRNNARDLDPESETARWQSLEEHTAEVTKTAGYLADKLDLRETWCQALTSAGDWHDVGKAHPRWQNTLPTPPDNQHGPWGKFDGKFKIIPTVRHEGQSLLAAWNALALSAPKLAKLALYLIASHHGKIRTVLRSRGKGKEDNFFGWHGSDQLVLPNGTLSPVLVDLSVRDFSGTGDVDWEKRTFSLGRPSWTTIIEELLGPAWPGDIITKIAVFPDEPRELGPFQLAYIETVFRAADVRASKDEIVPSTP